jgi:site-specific recombinase XerD
VFPGYYGREHVTPQTIWNWIRLVAEESGVDDRIWPHRLRHTALATANDNTGDLRSVADFARHRDIAVTMIYTRTTEKNLRRISDSLEYG